MDQNANEGKEEILIDKAKAQTIIFICSVLENGRSGEAALARSIKEHIEKYLPPELKRLADNYVPSASSMGRLLIQLQPLQFSRHPFLEKILNSYIEHNKDILALYKDDSTLQQMPDTFPPDVINTLCERAGTICSNPDCRRPTVGPVLSKPNLSVKIGVGCFIHGPLPGMPRYNAKLSEAKKYEAENGIWLCRTDSDLVNAAGGADYPATVLKNWKSEHEQFIKLWMEGKSSSGLGFNLSDESNTCAGIVKFVDERKELFVPLPEADIDIVAISVKEVSMYLEEIMDDVIPGTRLDGVVNSMINICSYFLSKVNERPGNDVLQIAFGAMRKALGLTFRDMEKDYKIDLTENIQGIMPPQL